MSGQLALDVDPPREPPPRSPWFDNLGRPRRLLWCSDRARMGGRCPHGLDGGALHPSCCKAIRLRNDESPPS